MELAEVSGKIMLRMWNRQPIIVKEPEMRTLLRGIFDSPMARGFAMEEIANRRVEEEFSDELLEALVIKLLSDERRSELLLRALQKQGFKYIQVEVLKSCEPCEPCSLTCEKFPVEEIQRIKEV